MFLWGTAMPAHQVEGNDVHSDWWDSEQRGLLPHKSGRACDFWNRWREDFDLAASLGHNTLRLSVEWARLEPEPGRWDEAALDQYAEMVEDLRRRGLEPVVTLHHFVNPLWFARAGGFEKRKNLDRFERFADRVAAAPDREWAPSQVSGHRTNMQGGDKGAIGINVAAERGALLNLPPTSAAGAGKTWVLVLLVLMAIWLNADNRCPAP